MEALNDVILMQNEPYLIHWTFWVMMKQNMNVIFLILFVSGKILLQTNYDHPWLVQLTFYAVFKKKLSSFFHNFFLDTFLYGHSMVSCCFKRIVKGLSKVYVQPDLVNLDGTNLSCSEKNDFFWPTFFMFDVVKGDAKLQEKLYNFSK